MQVSAPREKFGKANFSGVALRRGKPVDAEQAHTLADEIIEDLSQVQGKLRKLEQLGWDGGGQPAYVDCERLKVESWRADGSPKQKVQKVRHGEEFPAMVSGVGPRDQSLGVKATRPLESALSGQGQGTRDRFPVVLPAQFYPAEPRAAPRADMGCSGTLHLTPSSKRHSDGRQPPPRPLSFASKWFRGWANVVSTVGEGTGDDTHEPEEVQCAAPARAAPVKQRQRMLVPGPRWRWMPLRHRGAARRRPLQAAHVDGRAPQAL
eukprot:SAG11_NODE_7322_length_1160_cov_2.158341_2_plen_263_part_01